MDLAKAKTHAMMTLTLAVKNLFGLIDSADRISWHLAVGSDFSRFADLLLDLYLTVRPKISIIDGIIGMEGNGPGGIFRCPGFGCFCCPDSGDSS